MSSDGTQNPFPCFLVENIHLKIFFQLQSYLPEGKYFHLGYDSPLKISIYSESADIPWTIWKPGQTPLQRTHTTIFQRKLYSSSPPCNHKVHVEVTVHSDYAEGKWFHLVPLCLWWYQSHCKSFLLHCCYECAFSPF